MIFVSPSSQCEGCMLKLRLHYSTPLPPHCSSSLLSIMVEWLALQPLIQ